MKKQSLIFMSAVLIMSILTPVKQLMAGDIDKATARQVAAYFMASQFGNKSITANSLDLVYVIPNTERNIPALYFFNTADKQGFVVISGSDCVSPIIAFSTEGALDPDNIPDNMMWWMNGQAQNIVYAQNNGLQPSSRSVDEWSELTEERLPYFGANNSKVMKILMNSKWDQEPLYNGMCPYDAGGQCVTGCVATAMAQIIYYWRYPRVGYGLREYFWNGNVISVDFSQAYYDYDNMVDKLTYSSTQAQKDAVALLNYHAGVSVKMDFGSESSGAFSADVPFALYFNFKYDRDSIKMLSRDDYEFRNTSSVVNAKDSLWVKKIMQQLKLNRPVYYSGYDPSGGTHAGHAFVCDGWREDATSYSGYLHFNWGWGGTGLAWCNVYTSQLSTSNNPSTGYNFTQSHNIIVGITPPYDSIPEDRLPVRIESESNPFTASIYPNPTTNQITVSYAISEGEEMQIFDAAGRIVKRVTLAPASMQITISVADLRPGVYVCRLQGQTKKFIVK